MLYQAYIVLLKLFANKEQPSNKYIRLLSVANTQKKTHVHFILDLDIFLIPIFVILFRM